MKTSFYWIKRVVALVGIVLLIILPFTTIPRNWLLYLFLYLTYLAMANMWNLLAGYSGLLSLCQPAFIGIAGYTLVVFTWSGLPFYLGIIGGGVTAALIAVIISLPVFRLRGIYFAIGTLIIPELLRIIFLMWKPVKSELSGGGAGYAIKGIYSISLNEIYWLILIICVISIVMLHNILHSKLGLGLAAIRDNERAAESSGIPVFKIKLITFILSAFVTGLAGAVFYVYQGYIEPSNAFNIRWTMVLMLATVIGGMGTELGPVVGAIIVVILHFTLSRFSGLSLLIQGIILVVIMLLAPKGIIGLINNLFSHPNKKAYSGSLSNRPA